MSALAMVIVISLARIINTDNRLSGNQEGSLCQGGRQGRKGDMAGTGDSSVWEGEVTDRGETFGEAGAEDSARTVVEAGAGQARGGAGEPRKAQGREQHSHGEGQGRLTYTCVQTPGPAAAGTRRGGWRHRTCCHARPYIPCHTRPRSRLSPGSCGRSSTRLRTPARHTGNPWGRLQSGYRADPRGQETRGMGGLPGPGPPGPPPAFIPIHLPTWPQVSS